jgi:hypothetical protein
MTDSFLGESLFLRFWFAGGLCLPGILGFDEGFQIVQAGGPEDTVLLEPGVDGAEWFGIQLVNPVAAFAVFADEMGTAKKSEMFRDGGSRDRKGIRELAGRLAAAAEQI